MGFWRLKKQAELKRKLDPKELERILRDHEEWVASGYPESDTRRADFSDCDLAGAHLMGRNLTRAVFRGAALEGAWLNKANLSHVDFRKANLRGARLRDANLLETEFQNSDLQAADLTGTQNTLSVRFGGANLRTIQPRDAIVFDGIAQVDEGLKNAGKLYLTLLSLCAFAVLVVVSTQDVQLVTNTGQADLPLINLKIPIKWFFFLTPVLIVLTFVTMHLHLFRAWEAMVKLPSVFADGLSIDQKVHPLFLNSIMISHLPRWKETPQVPFHRLQRTAGAFTAYFVPLAALVLIWGRYLVKQQWTVSAAHLATVGIVGILGLLFHSNSLSTARGDSCGLLRSTWELRRKIRMTLMLTALGLSLCTFGAIQRRAFSDFKDARWFGAQLDSVGIRGYAELTEQDISTEKPSDWKTMDVLMVEARAALMRPGMKAPSEKDVVKEALHRMDIQIQKVKPARLAHESLRGAQAGETFLAKADLRGVDLTGANLSGADLSGVKLDGANLNRAILTGASLVRVDLPKTTDLKNAILDEADIRGAHLLKADLRIAHLGGADLRGADMRHANLEQAVLNKAILVGANLRGANMSRAKLIGAVLTSADLSEADLPDAWLSEANLVEAHLELADLHNARFTGTDLRGAGFQQADVSGANLKGAKNVLMAHWEGAEYTRQDYPKVKRTRWPDNFDPLKHPELIEVDGEGNTIKPTAGQKNLGKSSGTFQD